MGWEDELAHSAGVQFCLTPDCSNLVPVLLAWHSTLYNQHPLLKKPSTSIDYLGRVGKGDRMNIRHLLQRPLKVTHDKY
jgi:hypothetical protein